jgi:hypothetical protein
MELPGEMLNKALMGGLLVLGFVLAWLIGAALGGWKFGKFFRQVELTVDRDQLPAFTERLYRRLAELEFVSTGMPGEFSQGIMELLDAGAFSHAKTPKFLNVAVNDSGQPQVTVQLSLQYRESIVADTGEGAYRDAVLDYISGRLDIMKVVPNRSFMAVCSLVGGILAWVPLFGFFILRYSGFFEPVLVLSLTYLSLSIIAAVAIVLKRGQATGLLWAIGGTVASCGALVVGIACKMLTRY